MIKMIATGGLTPVFANANVSIGQLDPDTNLTQIVEIWKRSKGTEV